MMRAATVKVNFDLVASLLFGPGTKIHMARQSWDDYGGLIFDMIIEHPDFPENAVGEKLPHKTCVVHTDGDKISHFFIEAS